MKHVFGWWFAAKCKLEDLWRRSRSHWELEVCKCQIVWIISYIWVWAMGESFICPPICEKRTCQCEWMSRGGGEAEHKSRDRRETNSRTVDRRRDGQRCWVVQSSGRGRTRSGRRATGSQANASRGYSRRRQLANFHLLTAIASWLWDEFLSSITTISPIGIINRKL